MRRSRRLEDTNYAELFLSLVMIRFVILALMLVFLVPKKETPQEANRDRGNIRVEISWETGIDADVDLWVLAPGDKPVGWSNKNGKYFDLVRDDLGKFNNPTGIHYEIGYGRGLPDGEYVINVHLYANREANRPVISVQGIITLIPDASEKGTQTVIRQREVKLTRVGEEVTLVRFTIKNRQVVPGSLSTIYKSIYRKQ